MDSSLFSSGFNSQSPDSFSSKPTIGVPWYRRSWGGILGIIVLFLIIIGINLFNDALYQSQLNNSISLDDIHKNFTQADVKTADTVKPNPTLTMNFDTKSAPSFGSANSPITVVEFGDFQCPFCSQVASVVRSWQKNYVGTIRVVFRQFPVPSLHPDSVAAAEASLCAKDQEKFWEYYDILYANQADLSVKALKQYAQNLGLDTKKFNDCVDARNYRLQVESDIQDGMAAGVTGTPTWFVNNVKLEGAVPAIIWDEIFRRLKDKFSR
jgi:protein-disulfide isomerase